MRRIIFAFTCGLAANCLATPLDATQQRALLETIVLPITTEIGYDDGAVEVNEGTGFVVGYRFYTVYHNISIAAGRTATRRAIRVAGALVEPMFADPEMDLAVFELPSSLCRSHCNGVSLRAHAVAPGEGVFWLRRLDEQRVWNTGKVQNVSFKSPPISIDDCHANMVAEIDSPFVPGTSGGPVLDSRTGEIIGVIQGSFARADGSERGYFKPTACLPYVVASVD